VHHHADITSMTAIDGGQNTTVDIGSLCRCPQARDADQVVLLRSRHQLPGLFLFKLKPFR
jgi:hypothetical protein